MRLPVEDMQRCCDIISAALDVGINHFDHASIYAGGEAERSFGRAWQTMRIPREDMLLTSKCGIHFAGDPAPGSPKRYDLSRATIIATVEDSLRRLQTDYLDNLLLHRPDMLMQPEEVASAFEHLGAGGKVRNFGVSNFSPSQVALLNAALPSPVSVNQIEFSLAHLAPLFDGSLDQCLQLGMQVQAWSPLRGSITTGGDTPTTAVNDELQRQALHYGIEPWGVALAWLLRHPADIYPIVGTTNTTRIAACAAPCRTVYEREDWYRLLEASRGHDVA